MQALLGPTHAAVPCSHGGRRMDSYDSGEEFSFYHWTEIRKLVDEADVPSESEGLPHSEEIEEALEETRSEVEPTTAYQHFTGNII